MTAISLAEYYERLSRHDWAYEMSDDPGIFRAGVDERAALHQMSRQSDGHGSLWLAFTTYHGRGGPMPERPRREPAHRPRCGDRSSSLVTQARGHPLSSQ